jgi:hypothetical protein
MRSSTSDVSIWRRWKPINARPLLDILSAYVNLHRLRRGITSLLVGLIAEDDRLRAMGCMGVGAVGEFGASDSECAALRAVVTPLLRSSITERLRAGQATGEFDQGIDPEEAAAFIQMTMSGLQLGVRAGTAAEDLQKMARFAVDRLRAR